RRVPRPLRLLLPFRPRLLRRMGLRRGNPPELLRALLRRPPEGPDVHGSAAHDATPRRGAEARDDRAPLHLSALRSRDRRGEARCRLPRDARAPRRDDAEPRASLLRRAVPDRAGRRRVLRPRAPRALL